MKKLSLIAAIVAVASLASCTAQAPKANLKSDIDSLSYMLGISNTQGLDMYLMQQGVDSTKMNKFLEGLLVAINEKEMDEAYKIGYQIGQQINGSMFEMINGRIFNGDSARSLVKDNFLAGFVETLKKTNKATVEEAQKFVEETVAALQEKSMLEKYGENKEAGEKFLEDNKANEGVQVTESGLQYKVLVEGKGAVPTAESRVKCHYHGTLIDGTVFDSSVERGEPTEFDVTGVIKGWTEALQMMPVGSKWQLVIPQELAYGSRDMGKIKPFSTLIFEVELLDIVK